MTTLSTEAPKHMTNVVRADTVDAGESKDYLADSRFSVARSRCIGVTPKLSRSASSWLLLDSAELLLGWVLVLNLVQRLEQLLIVWRLIQRIYLGERNLPTLVHNKDGPFTNPWERRLFAEYPE